MKKMELILVQSYLLSAERKVKESREEVKNWGKMTMGLESRFTGVLDDISKLRKTIESWEIDGGGQ